MGYDFSFEAAEEDDARSQFRWNIWGMAWMNEVMRRAGVLGDDPSPMPVWPPEGLSASDAELGEIILDLSRVVSDTCELYGFGLKVDGASALLRGVAALIEDELPDSLVERVTADLDAAERARVARSADPATVPAYKFESNEGWLVCPEECRVIAAGLRRALEARGDALFPTEPVENEVTESFVSSVGLPRESYCPEADEARASTLAWIDYNERAAEQGGYRVT